MSNIREIIRSRRSVFPRFFTGEPLEREKILQLLEDANWAPTHKMTEPWRFVVFMDAGLQKLADYVAGWYRDHTGPERFSERKMEQKREKVLSSAAVIAIVMHRDPRERVPEWEELAATSCAVQNLWLSAWAQGLGGYWSSSKAMIEAHGFLGLSQNERCLGVFYLGHHNMPPTERKRGPIEEKVVFYR